MVPAHIDRVGPFLAGLFAVLAAACSTDGTGTSTGAIESKLDGRTFVSTAVEGRELVAGTEIRIRFHARELSASAGCNSMGGPYRIEGGALEMTGLSMTEMGCEAPLGEQDTWLGDVLTSSPKIALVEPELTIEATTSTITLLDREVASPDRPLVGTRWIGNGVGDGEAVTGGEGMELVTISFADDGSFSVFTGCQSGSGLYSTLGSAVRFESVTYDPVACSDARMETWSSAVHTVLDGSQATFAIEELNLDIEGSGRTLYFRAAE